MKMILAGLAVFVFLAIQLCIVFCIDYSKAKKKQMPNMSVQRDDPVEPKTFRPELYPLIPVGGAIILMTVISVSILSDAQGSSESGFWELACLLTTFICILLYGFIRAARLLVHISPDGVMIRRALFCQMIPKSDIEAYCMGNAGIYIKRKSKRFPVVIEKSFTSNKALCRAISALCQS